MAVVEKPRIRVKARTVDSVQNFIARVGLGTPNQAAATTYGPSPISRNRLQLEYAYRSSWICRQVVDAPAEDMTRAGIDIETKDPKDGEVLQKAMQRLAIWPKKRETIQWSRLYGGAIGVIMIDGQDEKTPLRPETVGKNAFKGILPLDRWSVQPSFTDLISELGPNYGQPKFYEVTAAVMNLPRLKVHYSRVVRFEGEDLPIWQKMTENGWGLSVLEPVWDRLTSFDSTTVGIGQLVFKAHLRTLQVEGLREALASNGPELTGIMKNIDLIRATQTNEGMTLLDIQDKFEAHQYSFGGLSDVLIQFRAAARRRRSDPPGAALRTVAGRPRRHRRRRHPQLLRCDQVAAGKPDADPNGPHPRGAALVGTRSRPGYRLLLFVPPAMADERQGEGRDRDQCDDDRHDA